MAADSQALARLTPMELIQQAIAQSADVDKLGKLLELQQRWEADQARKAFDEAFAEFKAEAVEIVKNRLVSDGPLKGKKYAELFTVVNAVTPALSKHGLSASWKLTKDERDWIEVTCTLAHALGHIRTASMSGPPDTGGAKSPIQARASTVTYLERYTLKAVCGLAEKGDDDDGSAVGRFGELAERLEWIANAKDEEELRRIYSDAYKEAKLSNDKAAMQRIIDAKDKRRKELD